ncbi:uncharacterized protein LOC130665846 [Microplitis mediator]|uniref:uncharacterized protein LOC130665846 n=1 Tax=Microplitis mediator TaxID=375433 RepID=UPI0025538FE7|nr:uncharacterized protein LOC130665846 [Microplitis mediator]
MSNVTPFCVFCKKKNSFLKSFSKDNLIKCSAILIVRKNNKLTGHEWVLPTEQSNFQLYHSECYRRFTALPPKYRKKTAASEDASSSRLPQQADDNAHAEASGIASISNVSSTENVNLGEVNLDLPVSENVSFAGEPDIAPENITEDVTTDVTADVTTDATDDGTEDKNIYTCLFCGKTRKKFRGREEKLSIFTKNGLDSVEILAVESNDYDMTPKLQNLPSDQEYFFHKNCKNNYITSRKSILQQSKEKSEWHLTRNIRAEAYDVVEKFVAENIVRQEQSFFLKFLNDMFTEHLIKNQQDVSSYSFKPYHLKKRLLKKFSKQISIISFKDQIMVKPFKGIMIKNEVEKQNISDAAASILHDEIPQ